MEEKRVSYKHKKVAMEEIKKIAVEADLLPFWHDFDLDPGFMVLSPHDIVNIVLFYGEKGVGKIHVVGEELADILRNFIDMIAEGEKEDSRYPAERLIEWNKECISWVLSFWKFLDFHKPAELSCVKDVLEIELVPSERGLERLQLDRWKEPDLVLRLEAPKEFLEAYPGNDDPFGKLERLMHDFFHHQLMDIYSDWIGRRGGVGHTRTELEEGHYIECEHTLNPVDDKNKTDESNVVE